MSLSVRQKNKVGARLPRPKIGRIFAITFVVAFFIFLSAESAEMAINKQINYQGRLTNSSYIPVTNGTVNIKFAVYDSASAGTCLWVASGTCSVPTSVPVSATSGLFSIMLGDTSASGGWQNALDLDFNSDSYFLGVAVEADAEMTPRKRVGAAGYAFNADLLDGYDSTAFLRDTTSTIINRYTFTSIPEGVLASQGTLYLNPASAQADYTLMGIAINGAEKFRFDADGDLTASNSFMVSDGSTTSTLTKSSLILAGDSSNALGKFYIDLSGNVSASGSLYTFGNVTSTGIIYASNGLISSASSTFTSNLSITGNLGQINTVAYTWPSSQGGASTYLKNNGSGTLTWDTVTGSGTNDWGRFSFTYGALALMTSSTYPVWFDGAVYASSTLITSGNVTLGDTVGDIVTINGILGTVNISNNTNATTTLTRDSLALGITSTYPGTGVFYVDSSGNVTVSGSLWLTNTTVPSTISLRLGGDGNATTTLTHGYGTTSTIHRDTGFELGGGAVSYGASSTVLAVSALEVGNLDLPDDAGMVSWTNMDVTTTTANIAMSYSASMDDNDLLTIYGNTNGSGGVNNLGVAIATSTAWEIFDVNHKFTVASSTGNVSASGTLSVWGSQTASSSILSSNALTLGKGTNYNTGMFYVDSSGNVSASGTLGIFGNATIGGHLYPRTDNLYDVGASSTQWRYGNFQGGLLVADGLATTTLDKTQLLINEGSTSSSILNGSSLTLGKGTNYTSGMFNVASNGNVSASGTISIPSGSNQAPSLTFIGDTDTGIFRTGSNLFGLTAAGGTVVSIASSYVSIAQTVYLQDGSKTAPILAFVNDQDTGIFRSAGNRIDFVAGGSHIGYFDPHGLRIGNGSVTSTLSANFFAIATSTTAMRGVFYVDSSGNLSASGSLYTFGNVTSTGILYATNGLISSASSTFTSNLQITGNARASSTLLVGTAAGTNNFYVNGVTTQIGSTAASGTLQSYGNAQFTGTLTPEHHNTYDLGSYTASWNDIFASGTIYGNLTGTLTSSGHFLPATDNLYDIGSSSTQWRYGNFQGGLLVADGSATTTILGGSATTTIAGGLAIETTGFVYDWQTNNVGIGTTAPASQLHVRNISSGAPQAKFDYNGTADVSLGGQWLNLIPTIGTFSNNPLGFATNNAERMRIDTAGNLGIGLTNPDQKLTIAGGNLAIGNGSVTSTLGANFFAIATSTTAMRGVFYIDSSGNVSASGSIMAFGNVTSTGIAYAPNYIASSATATSTLAGGLAIETTGFVYDWQTNNVGIGTAGPGAKLSIDGGTASDQFRIGDLTNGFYYKIGRNSGDGLLDFQGTQAGYNGYRFILNNGSTYFQIDRTGNTYINPVSGNVGIGTTSPADKLTVSSGHITATDNSSSSTLQEDALIVNQTVGTYDLGRFYVSSAGNIYASGTYYGAWSPTGHLLPASDNLYDVGASSTQWRYGNFQGGLLIADGSATTTILGGSATTSIAGGLTVESTGLVYDWQTNNVGIGTAAPDQKLTVAGYLALQDASSADAWVYSTAYSATLRSMGANRVNLVGSDNSVLIGASDGTATIYDVVTVKLGGNVGIGTSAPSYKLDISGDARLAGGNRSFYVTNGTTTSTLDYQSLIVAGSNTAALGKFYVDSSGNITASGSLWLTNTTVPSTISLRLGGDGSATTTLTHGYGTTSTIHRDTGFELGGGAVSYGASSTVLSVSSLEVGNLDLPDDGGMVSWTNMDVTTTTANIAMSYSASLDDNDLLTIYGNTDGSGGVNNLGVAIATSTAWEIFDVNHKFTVASSTGNLSASGTLYLFGSTTSTFSGPIQHSSGDLILSGAGITNDVLLSPYGGNVGIGTTNPGALLHILKTDVTGTSDMIKIAGAVNAANAESAMKIQAIYHAGFGADYNFQVAMWTGAYTYMNVLNLNANSNVGIGTTGPNQRLTIAGGNLAVGTGSVTSTLGANFFAIATSTTAMQGVFYIDSSGNISASGTLTAWGSQTASTSLLTSTGLTIGKGANYNSGVFNIDSSGNVSTSGTLNVLGGPNPLGSVAKPTHKGSLTDGGGSAPYLAGALSVFVSGNYAYVASLGSSALEIVDISNPASPVHKGSITDGGGSAPYLNTAYSVFVSGNYAYLGSNGSDALEIVDVSNPANPTHKGSLSNTVGGALLDGPRGVFVSGNYAYVASNVSNALEIIDISNPANPTHKGSLTHGTGGALLSGITSVFVSGNYAYVASNASNALEIIDISNPANPTHKGSLTHGTGGALLSSPYQIFVSGNYAYVASYGSSALEIVDISNPASPTHKGSLSNGTGGALLGGAISVFVSGNYAYVGNYTSDALEIVDVSNPANPVHKGSLLDGGGSAPYLSDIYGLFVSGNYVYVASYNNGALEIVDISGAQISNARIGSLLADTLQVGNLAQFNQGLLIHDGLSVGGNAQLFGDVSLGGGRATTTAVAGGGLTVITSQTSSTFLSRVFDVSANTGFIFNTGTSTWTSASDRYLSKFQTGGNDMFLFGADGSLIVNKASGYNQGKFYIDSSGNAFASGTINLSAKKIDGYFYPAFAYTTSTSWTGTTTIPLGTAYVAETFVSVQCFTDVGTVNVSFYDGTNRMDLFNASTTVGTVTFTTNNTFTAAEKRYVDIGTPATSPKKASCTVRKYLNP